LYSAIKSEDTEALKDTEALDGCCGRLGHLTCKNPSPIWPIMCLVGC